jgi:acyl-CoA reductase-like NAD-dependent aldehyde dehydrogenase
LKLNHIYSLSLTLTHTHTHTHTLSLSLTFFSFREIWKTIGNNISNYKNYPRIVGETGGKDFIFAHNSADVDALVTALIRGAFEYAGQKCSAASRVNNPKTKNTK